MRLNNTQTLDAQSLVIEEEDGEEQPSIQILEKSDLEQKLKEMKRLIEQQKSIKKEL